MPQFDMQYAMSQLVARGITAKDISTYLPGIAAELRQEGAAEKKPTVVEDTTALRILVEWKQNADVRQQFNGDLGAFEEHCRANPHLLHKSTATVALAVNNTAGAAALEILQQWKMSASLRREFGGNFGAFEAYKRAETEGRVKIVGRHTNSPGNNAA